MKDNKFLISLKMFKKAFWAYKYQIILLVGTGMLGAFAEAIGVNTIVPLFSIIMGGQDAPGDFVSAYIIKFFAFFHIPYSFRFLLIFIALLFILKAIMTFCTNYITDKIRTDYIKNTRQKLLSLALHTNWLYVSKQKVGYLEKVLMTDINVYSSLLTYISSAVIFSMNAFIYILIAFNISPVVTLITIGMGIIFFLGFKPLMEKVRATSLETNLAQKRVAHHINESTIGIKTVKAMALENAVVERGESFFETLRHNEMKLSVISSTAYVIAQPLSIFVILVLFSYSYKLTTFSLASFAVVVYAINRIFTYIQQGQAQFHNINSLYPFLRSVVDFEDEARRNLENRGGEEDFDFQKELAFNNVSFKYEKDGPNVLSNISFTVPKGTSIGFIGPSGSGKTTIVDSLLSLIKPGSGEITVDGKNLNNINVKAWKKRIGYVSQDTFLVNDSIKNNIAFYDPTISEADIIEAAKKAHIYDFIQSKPQGLDTPVGERGMELSGGQRQRIALARVLARKADILILDEATSALDNESEAAIQKAVSELHGQATILVIAHRPTTVANLDNIVVLKNGTITETGKPEELLKKDDSYFHKMFYAKH